MIQQRPNRFMKLRETIKVRNAKYSKQCSGLSAKLIKHVDIKDWQLVKHRKILLSMVSRYI